MNNDRELLELAAKAAGYGVKPHASQKHTPHLMFTFNGHNWNPLTDDGDALRLAVTLRFTVDIGIATVYVYSVDIDRSETTETKEYFHEPEEAYAATRRAVVRAAAEIGRAME